MTNAEFIQEGISRLFTEFAEQLPSDEEANPLELFAAEMHLQRAWVEYVNSQYPPYEPPRLATYGDLRELQGRGLG